MYHIAKKRLMKWLGWPSNCCATNVRSLSVGDHVANGKRLLILVVVLLACTSSALASVSLYVSATLTYSYQGEWVGPIPGKADGGSSIDLWCNDYTHVTYVPQTYNALVSTIPEVQGTTRWGDQPDAVTLYEQAAWLMGQFYAPGFTKNNTTVGDLQFAIWALFNPIAVNNDHKLTAGAQNWLTKVQGVSNLGSYDYSNVRIFTPANCVPPTCTNQQEFMSGYPLHPVPEPPAALTPLLGFGVVGVMIRLWAAQRA